MEREPAAWETNAAGPFPSVGEVGVHARGEDRFRLVSPAGEREVEDLSRRDSSRTSSTAFRRVLSAPGRQHPLRDTGGAVSANLDLVRPIYAALEGRDYGYVDWADPNIEYVSVDGPEPGSSVGLSGLTKGWSGWMSAWQDFHIEADEFRELDEGHVLALDHSSGRGRASGLEVQRSDGAVLFQVRGGRVVRMVAYWDRERALANLGLEG